MSEKILKATIMLRRDTITNYASHGDHIPLRGEVCIVDPKATSAWATEKKIRIKIGDGSTTFNDLPYADQQTSNVFVGYFNNGKFYFDKNHLAEVTPDFCDFTKMIFVDLHKSSIYYYDNEHFITSSIEVPSASEDKPGIMKLYQTLGQNTDGTMSQKAITEAISKIRLAIENDDSESLYLVNPTDEINQ